MSISGHFFHDKPVNFVGNCEIKSQTAFLAKIANSQKSFLLYKLIIHLYLESLRKQAQLYR